VRGARLAILGAVCLSGFASPAAGHDPLGRAQPSVATTLKGSGLSRTIGFRVRDSDSGNPIPEATLSVLAAPVGGSSVPGDVTRIRPELFRVKLDFPQAGNWSVHVDIAGNRVTPTSFSFDVPVVGGAETDGSSGGLDAWILVTVALASLAGVVLGTVLIERRRRRRRA
jgi:hypothetical protein